MADNVHDHLSGRVAGVGGLLGPTRWKKRFAEPLLVDFDALAAR
jgi:hypothetical protein